MPQPIQRSFTSGEIAPALRARTDLIKYATGLAKCENFIVRSQGGVYNRPGTRFICEVGDSTRRARLVPFQFNTEQTYILVFEHNTIRFIRDGVLIESGGSPYEIVSPYTEDELDELDYTQSADVMTLVHHNHDPRNLSRLADDNWSLDVINYASTVSAPTWAGTPLTAVGTGAGSYNKTYRYVVTAVDADGVESLASIEKNITTASLSVTAGVKLDWDAVVGAVKYRIYKDPSNNSGVYGWIGNSETTEFTDFNVAPVTSDAPPEERLPFNGVNDKPGTVAYFQQRQVFANTLNEPQAVFTTQTANYKSLRTSDPTRDDDAVTFTVVGQQVNEIRHLISLDSLIIMTSGGEWITTEGQDQVLTPSTVGVRIQSYNGSSRVKPVIINSTALYVQEKGTRIRDLGYEFNSDKYTGNDVSLMSEHLFEGYEIVDMTYAAEPYSIVWCVRNDGVLLGLTYQREHQVWAWHQHVTDGEIESVTSVTEGDRDAVYVSVKRTIDGNTVRYVERMESRVTADTEDGWFVDSGLDYEGAAVTSLAGLDHLEGETVSVLADGYVVKSLTVTGGSITLPRAASRVIVGLPYTSTIDTLDVDQNGGAPESLKWREMSVSKVFMELEKSRGGFVAPIPDNVTGVELTNDDFQFSELKPRFQNDQYNAIKLRTYKAEVLLQPQQQKGGGVRVQQRDPLPMAILSITPWVDVGGG